MSPPIIDRTTLFVFAVILMVGSALIFAAIQNACGWKIRVPKWAAGASLIGMFIGLSAWHDKATDIQLEACGDVFGAYMQRDDYPAWSASCSEVMLSPSVKDNAALQGVCIENATALLSDGSVFESRFEFQETYCRKALSAKAQADVVASVRDHCQSAQAELGLAGREALAAYARLCPDDATVTKAALPPVR